MGGDSGPEKFPSTVPQLSIICSCLPGLKENIDNVMADCSKCKPKSRLCLASSFHLSQFRFTEDLNLEQSQ